MIKGCDNRRRKRGGCVEYKKKQKRMREEAWEGKRKEPKKWKREGVGVGERTKEKRKKIKKRDVQQKIQ